MEKFKNKKLIIFDLDDTLYLESDYVLSGFRAISTLFSKKYGIDEFLVYLFLSNEFFINGREKIFNKLFSRFSLPFDKSDIDSLVISYREHIPSIKLPDYSHNLLVNLKSRDIKIAIVTDGLPLMQKNKIHALNLVNIVDKIVYCWEIQAPKPETAGFLQVINFFNVEKENTLIIGDNPAHDIQAANMLGVDCYRVLTGRFRDVAENSNVRATKYFNNLEDIFGDNFYVNNY